MDSTDIVVIAAMKHGFIYQNLEKEESLIPLHGVGSGTAMKNFNQHDFHNPKINARYLGLYFNYNSSTLFEVQKRIAVAHNVHIMLWHFGRHRVDIKLKVIVSKSFVQSFLLFGMISTTPSDREMGLMDACRMKLGRKALAVLGCWANLSENTITFHAVTNVEISKYLKVAIVDSHSKL